MQEALDLKFPGSQMGLQWNGGWNSDWVEGRLSISLLVGVSPMPYAFILVGLTCSVTPMYNPDQVEFLM